MPGKHVHFVDSPTPSPSFSNSTLTNSPGPATPPPTFYSSPLAKANMYIPAQYAVHIHPLLARTIAHGAPLLWDMAEPAETARPQLPNAPPRITDALVREPATNPPLPSLAIICEFLPWTITIQPTPHARWASPFVTVGDVLHALYRALRLGVTDPELGVLEPAQKERVRDAYVRRYRRAPDARHRESEKAKGIKRVDFLRDYRAFLGLAPVPAGLPAKGLAPGVVWALQVARA